MYYDDINGSEFEQDYLDGEDVYSGLGFLGAAKKKAEAAMGPKQKACLAKGGRWEGPEGKKTCVMPQIGTAASATAEQVAAQQAAEALRKQAEKAAAAATAAKKEQAAMGPKQKACLAKGGRWEASEAWSPNRKAKMHCVMPGQVITPEQLAAQQAAEALRKQAEEAAAAAKKAQESMGQKQAAEALFKQTEEAAAAAKKAQASMGPKQKACVNKGGTWTGPKGKMYCVMPGQAITPDQPVEQPVTAKLPTMGPKQSKCLAQGGQWVGPKGKMYCVLPGQAITPDRPVEVPGSTNVVPPSSPLLTVQGYPKPGSFYSGPMPPAPPGGWPPFKGSPGPAQRKCLKQGGQWIGPAGKKWCQLGIGGEVVPPVAETPSGTQPPVVVGPAIQCGSGYVLQGQDCYPAESAPGAGYELVRYGGSKYFQWVYTGKGMAPDGWAGGSVPPWTDWSRGGGGSVPPWTDWSRGGGGGGGGGGGSIQPYPVFDESGQYDYGGVDYGQAPPPLPGPTLDPIDEGLGPLEMSAGAQVYAECDATFNANLPMAYSDKYGPMKVLQVFCKQTGGSASQPGPQQPIEAEEMAQVFAPTEGGF